ncbi:MAG: hypothetical protein WBA17_04095 [Saprospiraceae bacterium]
MATIQNNPNPNPSFSTPPPTPPEKKNNRTAIMGAIIVALVLICGGLTFWGLGMSGDNADLTAQNTETEDLKAQVEQQYYESLSELEEMRGSNEELNAMIEMQQGELKQQKEKIEGLLRDNRNLGSARSELKKLRTQTDQYLAELNQLRAENAELTDNNARLATERDNLSTDLTQQRDANQQLNSDNAVLVSQREEVSQKYQAASKKVTAASVIKMSSVTAEGQRERNNGKYKSDRQAKDVNRLFVCFNTTANDIAPDAEEVYFMRIISPGGETMAVESEGSGTFAIQPTGETVRYTKAVYRDYAGNPEQICADWSPVGQIFQEGNYKVEIYNKGYLAGSTEMELK